MTLERTQGQRMGALPVDPSRHFDHRVGRQVGDGAAAPNIHHLHVAGSRAERGHQPDRGLAVERPTPLRQQIRLAIDGWVAIQCGDVPRIAWIRWNPSMASHPLPLTRLLQRAEAS